MPYRFEPKTLTRYVGFSRFLAMIELGLFVPKASLFEDQLEGVIQFTSVATAPKSVSASELIALREWIYVSCWYDDHHESHAMWQIYGNSHESVAVQTTATELIKANWSFPEKPRTLFDKVRYVRPGDKVDFESLSATLLVNNDLPEGFVPAYAAHSLFLKHKGYQFENEFRLVALDPKATAAEKNPLAGKYLSVESSRQLIQKIFVHPLAPSWFEEVVRRTADRYQLQAVVARSSLSHSQLVSN
jgi:hypothetical protein